MARKIILLLILLTLAAGYAHAIGVGREGIGFGKLGAMSKRGASVAPSSCGTGVIDASAGCPLPMLGM